MVDRRAAVDLQFGQVDAGVLLHRLQHVAGLIGHRLQRRPGEMGGRRAASQADDRAAGVRVPIRRTQADERRHEIDAARIGRLGRQLLDLGRGADQAQPVAEPLHDRAGDEDRAFQAIGDLAADAPADRRQQAMPRRDRLLARCSSAGSSRCRRCSWPCRARSRPGRTWPPAGRRPRQRSEPARRTTRRSFRRRLSLDDRTSGSIARGTPRMRSSSSSQSSVWMLKSSVRLALLKSVTWMCPPVSRQSSQESTVPKRISPRSARPRSPSIVSSRCLIFVPEK